MSSTLILIIVIIAFALLFDFLNGFHDAANSIATVVCTRVLTPSQAVAWAAFFNFIAAIFFGTHIAHTMGKGLIDVNEVDKFVILGGLVGAVCWNILTWYLALPTSSSHALIGGYAGAAIVKAGFGVLVASGWIKVLVFMILSPILGFILGMLNVVVATWLFRKSTPRKVDSLFRRLQLLSAGLYSLGHGSNDAQKTMGIISALLISEGYGEYQHGYYKFLGQEHELALWIIFSCQAAIALGTFLGGWRIVKTMGSRITRLQPFGGFCAETAGATTLIGTAFLGIPVSTTHAITGAILGVGSAKSIHSVRWSWGQRIVMAWIFTLPGSAAISAIAYLIIHYAIQPFFH